MCDDVPGVLLKTPGVGEEEIDVLVETPNAEEMAIEMFWLRDKLKDITADRDRLICEVANLRLELDMAELKRLPEEK